MKIKKFFFLLFFTLFIACLPQKANADFEICFFDVGQGDAALISCDGHYVLIDGGEPEYSSKIYSYLEQNGINHFDYVIATHVHSDHIGGLSGALNYATVDNVFCNTTESKETGFKNLKKYTEYQGKQITVPNVGSYFEVGTSKMEIISPIQNFQSENDNSILVRFIYGNTSFLFMADAGEDAEKAIINLGYDLQSTVLKVGHHGSKKTCDPIFISEVSPQYAIISAGKGNQYDHPYNGTIDTLSGLGVSIYRTDELGDIYCTSDGNTVEFVSERLNNTNVESNLPSNQTEISTFVCNTNTKKVHSPYCSSVSDIKEKNKMEYTGTAEELKGMGYDPCGRCKPF